MITKTNNRPVTLRCLDRLAVILVRAHPFVLVVIEKVFIW